MPGLIFHYYNLSAVAKNLAKEDMRDDKKLLQWLDLFGPSGEKRLNDVRYLQKEEPILWRAYEMLTQLPEEISKESAKEQKIYHITQQEKEISAQIGEARGREAERLEVAQNMLREGVALAIISKVTKFSAERLEVLKKNL